MGFRTVNRVLHWRLPPTPKAVLLLLAIHENDTSGRCDPSVVGLAAESGLSNRAVQKALTILVSRGAIIINPVPGRRSNYVIADHLPPNHVHPRTTFTPEPGSDTPERRSQTPEPRSPEQEEQEEQEGSAASSPLPGDADTKAMGMVGPVFKTKAGDWRLTTVQHASLAAAHPGRDIESELRKAALWAETNPGKRKTPRGMFAFIARWLARSKPDGAGSTDQDFYDSCNAAAERLANGL